MVVGITRVTLAIPGNYSLKGKRSVVKKLLDRIRARFHVAAAEVDLQDDHDRGVIGLATVGADGRKVSSVLDHVVSFIDGAGLAQVLSVEHESLSYGDATADAEFEALAGKYGAGEEHWPPEGVKPAEPKVRIRPGSLGFGSQKTGEEDE